jgi:hypothetical protein
MTEGLWEELDRAMQRALIAEKRIAELEAELQSVRQIAENRRIECNDNMRRIAELEALNWKTGL